MVAPALVDDPYPTNPGDKIMVLRSTRHDILAEMKARNQIDDCDLAAGRHWQMALEKSGIGGVRAIDPSKEAVDGGKLTDVLGDVQIDGMRDLRNARKALGPDGDMLITESLGLGMSLKDITRAHTGGSGVEYKYVRQKFRQCLRKLAKLYGYANSTSLPRVNRQSSAANPFT